MKSLVVYDSIHGNTEEIAKSIAQAIGDDVKVMRVSEVNPADLESVELLIVGSPTHGGRPTPKMKDFLDDTGQVSLKGVKTAGFDTRMTMSILKVIGFAARKISNRLKSLGGTQVLKPEGFFVASGEGPLVEGECERAAKWVREVIHE